MPTKYCNMTPEQKAKCHARKRAWALKNRDKIVEYKRKHYHENRDKYLEIERERNYKKLYGIGIEDYNRMNLEQGGRCAICGTDEPLKGKNKYFSVDHCHETGKVRGLLCVACNHLLGRYEKHRIKILEYLKQNQ